MAHHVDMWEIVLQGDLDVGIALVVFEPNVVPWVVLLDQVTFEDQRFQF